MKRDTEIRRAVRAVVAAAIRRHEMPKHEAREVVHRMMKRGGRLLRDALRAMDHRSRGKAMRRMRAAPLEFWSAITSKHITEV